MIAELKITQVHRYINDTSTSTSSEFMPFGYQDVKIQVGDCESSFDLKSFHFAKVEQGRVAELNYSIKVHNFDISTDKVKIFWKDVPHEIKQEEDNIIFKANNLNFKFYYELIIK